MSSPDTTDPSRYVAPAGSPDTNGVRSAAQNSALPAGQVRVRERAEYAVPAAPEYTALVEMRPST